jgi:transcriptional regulator with PAS, ATPase and Fis domain
LIVVLDCQDLAAWPERHLLAGVREISIGRGRARRFAVDGHSARLELADRWISQNHARLHRTSTRWSVEDLGSRNGTLVNGERVANGALGDGDVLECGGTFLMLRRVDETLRELEAFESIPEPLRTVSPSLGQELDVLRKVARSSIPVLVLGESGTGKEGIATTIHHLSDRGGPLVAVNCGAVPATLIESELFGTKRGAFSGAEERQGLVRSADKGTLFLDEMAELPLASQAALLRVLQEKQVLPLGSTRPLSVDIRVLAATNASIVELAAEGRFRRDLYARLRGYEVQLPPLRDRLEDLGLLLAALIKRHDPGGGPRTFSRDAAWALFEHRWPLNVRELEQSVTAALALAGPEIAVEHLPRPLRAAVEPRRGVVVDERARIIELLSRHGGNLSAVARWLSTSRSQLYRLLARHGINPEEHARVDDGEKPSE